jgi:hypothetical protein
VPVSPAGEVRGSQVPATPAAERAGVVRDFKQAWEAQDINALISLLDPDATAVADGGGVVSADLRSIEGAAGRLLRRAEIVGVTVFRELGVDRDAEG